MTKPIIVVKVPCKLLYVIQVKEFLITCSTSWPYLISEFLVAYITIVASDWPRTFLYPRCFCLALDLPKAVVALNGDDPITGSCSASGYPRPDVKVIIPAGCDYQQNNVYISDHTSNAVFIMNVTKSCEQIATYII